MPVAVPALALIQSPVRRRQRAGGGSAALVKTPAFAKCLESHARRVYGAVGLVEVSAAQALLGHMRSGRLADGFTARDV